MPLAADGGTFNLHPQAKTALQRMMNRIEAGYLFALCNPGSEKALKLEAEAMGLRWRQSYQRRGFVSFKGDADFSLKSLEVNLACSRRLCLSLGKASSRQEAADLIASIAPAAILHYARYHEWKMQGVRPSGAQRPANGDVIGTVVELGPSDFWAGLHRHRPFLSPDPAGDGGLEMPAEAPSRAWLKLEEAVRFLALEFTPQDIVVELGCAPGGVVLALLQRGVAVIGVDPAKMAEVIAGFTIDKRAEAPADRPWFFHSRKPAALTSKRDLGQGVTWFMSDMNQSPEVVIRECARFCQMAPTLRGALMTLKLTDLTQITEKETWLAALRKIGFETVILQQLSVHHKEFALLGIK